MSTRPPEPGRVEVRLSDGLVILEVGNNDGSDTIGIGLDPADAKELAENMLAAARAALQ